jgi:hypothetical protein
MARKQHNGTMVMGALLGGAVGAVTALWKTPYTGDELRRKLGLAAGPEGMTTHEVHGSTSTAVAAPPAPARSLADKALGLVEQAAAPLVGVKLGQTANNSQPGVAGAPTAATTIPVTTAASPVGVTDDGRITDTEFSEFPPQQPIGRVEG